MDVRCGAMGRTASGDPPSERPGVCGGGSGEGAEGAWAQGCGALVFYLVAYTFLCFLFAVAKKVPV